MSLRAAADKSASVRFGRSSDRLYLVIVSDCFFAVHRIFVATVFASINGVAVFRAVYGMFFGFIRVSRSGNVTIRIFVSALPAIMNGIPSVRTGRFDHNFPEFMPVYIGIIIGVGIAAKVTGIFRIPFFRNKYQIPFLPCICAHTRLRVLARPRMQTR